MALSGVLLVPAGPAGAVLPKAVQTADVLTQPGAETSEQAALDEARSSGERVEVVAQRQEDSLLFANPDGTFTQEITAGPQRVLQDDVWVPVDATLERRADGSVGPRAAAVDLSFSGGGDGPLVNLAEDGRKVSFSWPGALPEPVLDANTATYREVLPGVDLRASATPTGYSYVLVVKSAEAAKNAELTKLTLDAEVTGLSLRENPGGGLTGVDAAGETVFEGAAPVMWDSTGEELAAAGTPSVGESSGEDTTPGACQDVCVSRSV